MLKSAHVKQYQKMFWVCTLVLSIATSSFSQTVLRGAKAQKVVPGSEVVRTSRFSEAPSYIQMWPDKRIDWSLYKLWSQKVLKMSDDDGLMFMKEEKGRLGWVHKRFQQTRKGIPVEGSMYLFHVIDGKIHSMNGEFYAGVTADCDITLDESSALEIAKQHIGADVYKWELCEEEQFLKWKRNDPSASFFPDAQKVIAPVGGDPASGQFRMAYKFDIYAHEPMSRHYVYIDAQSGEILYKTNRIHTADVAGSANTAYSGTQPIIADFTGTEYRLRESGRGNGIRTFDMNTGTNYGAAVDFTDANNVWNNFNANQDEIATDAHWGAEMTYDYFLIEHGRNSIDNAGFGLDSYVHYSANFNNAYWNGSEMTYGDGDGGTFTPLTCIDVAGHEIGHGLTTFTANLVYANESGALNESFSDIFGAAIENYARPANWNWQIGEDITPSGNGIRNMQNPGLFGHPQCYMGANYYTGAGDNGGVHTNSGVQNHWFYLLTDGGGSVTGQGIVKSAQIAFRNLTVYLTTNSNYADARFFAIQSAIDLFGPCTPEVIATTDAWFEVCVGPPFSNVVIADFSATPLSSCSFPANIQFTNNSTNGGTFDWDFGDGSPIANGTNPQHTYNSYGLFDVTLTAYGGSCGNDVTTFTGYISIDPANSCAVNLIPGGTQALQTACSGNLYDTGGLAGNYADNVVSMVTIAPPGASTVSLTFADFAYEDAYDYLYVYDGPNIASPLIGSFTGLTLPGVITSTGGSITIREVSDPFVNDVGFDLSWSCTQPTAPPVPDFKADFLVTCSGNVQFTDLTTDGPLTWFWEFGDGFTSTAQNPFHFYQTGGTFTVKLTTTNSFGSTTEEKIAYIQVNKLPIPNVSDVARCGPGTLDLPASGSGDMEWYDAPQAGNLLFTGPVFTTPFLTNTEIYYVQDKQVQTIEKVGPVDNTFGGGGNHINGSFQWLEFDVFVPLTIVSAFVYSSNVYFRTVSLWDNTGALVQDTIINIPTGNGRIGLDFTLQPGSYRMGGTQMNLWRNNTGVTYPYTIPGKISITGSSAGANFYYYFYDWEIQEETCLSERTSVTATINPKPNATTTPTGNVNLCQGEALDIYGNGGGAYRWLSGGETEDSLSVIAAGTYYVEVTSAAGCVDTSEAVIVSEVVPVANISPNGPFTVCEGQTVTLNASPGTNILWSNGDTLSSIDVVTPGDYSVSLIDPNGCAATSTLETINVNSNPSTSIGNVSTYTVCGPDTFPLQTVPGGGVDTLKYTGNCPGTILLEASGVFTTYDWNTGSDSVRAEISATGDYVVSITDANGCASVDSIHVSLSPITLNLPFISTFNGRNESGSVNYLWWNFDQNTQLSSIQLQRAVVNANIEFSPIGEFEYASTGKYSFYDENIQSSSTHFYRLKVQMPDGSEHFSNVVELTTGVLETSLELSVFPNPGNGVVQIKTNVPECNLVMVNALGEEIRKIHLNDGLTTIDLSDISKGVYFFRMQSQGRETTIKYLKVQ